MVGKANGFETNRIMIVSIVLSMSLILTYAQRKSTPLPSQAQNTPLADEPITWEAQSMSFTLPAGWRTTTRGSDEFKAIGPDGVRLSIIIVDSPANPQEALREEYERKLELQRQPGANRFRYEEVRYLELDSVNGLLSRLVDDLSVDVVWQAFRKSRGKQQFIAIRLSITPRSFERRRDELYKILHSIRLIQS